MTDPVDPETGARLRRDVRPLTLTCKGESITVDMPVGTVSGRTKASSIPRI